MIAQDLQQLWSYVTWGEAGREKDLAGLSDEALLSGYHYENPEYFDLLLHRYGKRLWHYIFRLMGEEETTNDLFQETWLRVHRHCHQFRRQSRFSTWLYQIATNLCRDEFRRRQRQPTLESLEKPLDTAESLTLAHTVAATEISPGQQAVEEEIQEILLQGLRILNNRERIIFMLRQFEGLPHKDIARILRCPEGTIRSGFFTALRKLGKFLQKRGISI